MPARAPATPTPSSSTEQTFSATVHPLQIAGSAQVTETSADEFCIAGGERRVATACKDQILMPPRLDQAAVVEHDDLVGVAHGREPGGDRNGRPS